MISATNLATGEELGRYEFHTPAEVDATLAAAVAAGNGAVLKHANNVPSCALAIAEMMREADAPGGLLGVLLLDKTEVAGIIADDRIAAVTLTGSTAVGRIVAAQAGQALKPQVLELGGSDPFIVLADADIEAATRTAVKARFGGIKKSGCGRGLGALGLRAFMNSKTVWIGTAEPATSPHKSLD